MLLLMVDYVSVLGLAQPRRDFSSFSPWGGSDRIPFLPSLAQTPLEVFIVLGLGPWPNIYIDMGSLAFHPYKYKHQMQLP